MKFIDLNIDSPTRGHSFDALWSDTQQKGYIFWFPNEQSIGLTYTMPIAFVGDENPVTITIEDNDIFSFITNSSEQIIVDDYIFDGKPVYSKTITTEPEKVGDKYVHIFNVACCAQQAGEYICKVNIGDEGYIRIGADMYGECEPAYINLSNMGVEIPTGVQKAIYDANVHEDEIDNILINRKFKELLSNYWDIVANKGSYKSLSNSLEWFEWEDILKIREIWKHAEAGRTIFNDEDILSVFEDRIENTVNNFVRTTYISLYCSLQEETDNYDLEYNPEIAATVLKWSRNDVQLKIALLAQFFGIYFMPLHMSLLHAVAEDIVFTNTIKSITGAEVKHDDCFGDFTCVECNIKDNNLYKITNVRTQVTPDTIFGNPINLFDDDLIHFGVDVFPKNYVDAYINASVSDSFAKRYYTGPGVVIPITMTIPNQSPNDFIKQTIVSYTTNSGIRKSFEFYDIFAAHNNDINIAFNLLLTSAAKYNICFTFILGSSKTVTHNITLNVEDVDNLNINIYKIHAKNDINGLTYEDFVDNSCNKYLFQIQNQSTLNENDRLSKTYKQYLPYLLPDDPNYTTYNGIKLSRTIIVDVQNKNGLNRPMSTSEIESLRSLMVINYLEFVRYEYEEVNGRPVMKLNNGQPVISYLVYVSKKFYAKTPAALSNKSYNVIRNDLGFYPQFHYLEKMEGTSIDNYTVKYGEAVCCAAEINDNGKIKDFRYGHLINDVEWTFFNHLTNETIQHNASSRMPFIAKSSQDTMHPGYYDVSFKYSLTNGTTGECRLDSAFRIK